MFHLVEEYVKDLYVIGVILIIVPLAFLVGDFVLFSLSNSLDFFDYNIMIYLSLIIYGSSIVSYIGNKYHYKPFEKREISIPVWPILVLIAVAIVIYLFWRLSLK